MKAERGNDWDITDPTEEGGFLAADEIAVHYFDFPHINLLLQANVATFVSLIFKSLSVGVFDSE